MTWKWQKSATANDAVNQAPATGSVAMFLIKEMLKFSVGMTHQRSSDGTTMSTVTDQITTGAAGAGGFGNNSAYWIGRDGNGREFCIQRGTTDLVWRTKLSHSAHFTGGSPSATQTPSATDEAIQKGGGTDASPTFATVFGTNNTYHLHSGGEDAAPYHWWFYTTATVGGAHQTHGWFVYMQRGTYGYLDVAPYFFEFGSTTAPSASNLNGTPIGNSWFKKGLAGETYVAYNAGNWAGFLFGSAQPIVPASTSTQQLTTDPVMGTDTSERILMGRANNIAQPGRRGYLDPQAMRFNCTFRPQFDTEDITAAPWTVSTVYAADQTALANGNIYRCLTGGTSLSSGTGPSGTSNSISDNTVVWTFVEPSMRFSQLDVLLLRSPPGITLS